MLLLSVVFAQDVVIDESLATGSSANEVRGGTFTGAGWRVDDANSRMYWDLGTQLESGEISVTVDDISWDNLLLANNHLIELFSDGGHSSTNRAINFRLYGYGQADTYDEWGDVKLLGWDRTTQEEHLVAEARWKEMNWDGLPHTWRITWDLDNFVLYLDGSAIIDLPVTGIDLRVRYLWLPLEGWGGDYSAPIGTTYSDLYLAGWEPSAPDDTGTIPDDGDPTTFRAVEDVTAASWESGVYPVEDDLAVEGDGSENIAVTWMKFDLSTVTDPVASAVLTLHARTADDADGDGGTLYTGSDASWSEDTMTWATRPTLGAAVGTYGHVAPGATFPFDVTSVVQGGGPVVFAVASTGANGAHFSSKEDGDGSRAPQLVVTTRAGTGDDTGGTSPADDTSPGPDDTGDGVHDVEDTAGAKVINGGCGCAAGSAGAAGVTLGIAGWMLAWSRRRTR